MNHRRGLPARTNDEHEVQSFGQEYAGLCKPGTILIFREFLYFHAR